MVDSTVVTDEDSFVAAFDGVEDNPLNTGQLEELWSLWTERVSMFGPCVIVLVPEWFAGEEFGARRPFLFAQVEHDDESSGAVLFSDAHEVDISVVEQQVTDQLDYDQTVDKLDISGTDDYIEDAGKVWIPRSLMTVIEYDDGSGADEEPVAGVDSTDASSITGGVLGDN
jgi:hypothetical protein